MKINYENYPIIKLVEQKKGDILKDFVSNPIRRHQLLSGAHQTVLNKIISTSKIKYLTDSFVVTSGRDDILDKLTPLYYDCPIGYGIFLLRNFTIAYDIQDASESISSDFPIYNQKELRFFVFHKKHLLGYYYIAFSNHKERGTIICSTQSSKQHTDYFWDDSETYADDWFNFIVQQVMFLNYSQVEEKILPSNNGMNIFNCRYSNSTNKNIQIINNTWFTTLIQSNGFNVRGHFRLQPYGEGLSKKKLIWINDFEKHGYTRKAGILKDQE